MASSLLSKSAALIPMSWVRPLSGVELVVPFYHMVSDDRVPHVSNLYRYRTVAEFKADVEFFARHFTPVTLQDIVDALNGERALPRSCCHFTFDDGFTEMHDVVAPILQRAGIPATFFLITAFLDGGGLPHYNEISVLLDAIPTEEPSRSQTLARMESALPGSIIRWTNIEDRLRALGYAEKSQVRIAAEALGVDFDEYIRDKQPHLSSAQVKAMINQGFTIGSHSIDHMLYRDLSLRDQIAQTRESMEHLKVQFGVRTKAFAFPHNDGGVEKEFFETVFSEHLLDVSFGTSGLIRHFHPRNIQRVTMEKTSAPATQIIARQFARAAYHRLSPFAAGAGN